MAAWEFQSLQTIAEKNEWHKFISMQSYHSLIGREEMIPYCQDASVANLSWSPIARGVLTWLWDAVRDSLRETKDIALILLVRSRESDSDKSIIDRVKEVAKKKGLSMAQIAVAWTLSHQRINPVLGLNSFQCINEAVASINVKLTEERIKHLEEPYVPKGLSVIER